MMAAQLEVTTHLLILLFRHPRRTAKVPSTAGLIKSYSFLGLYKGYGDAVWTTY